MKQFLTLVADLVEAQSRATAEKLRRASPHWMRHTHVTHALAQGAEFTTVCDDLRHASVSTISIYCTVMRPGERGNLKRSSLHDDVQRRLSQFSHKHE